MEKPSCTEYVSRSIGALSICLVLLAAGPGLRQVGADQATLVKDIRAGAGCFDKPDGTWADYTRPAAMNGVLYFAANDGSRGMELWKSDGSAAGTVIVKDIDPGADSSFPDGDPAATWFYQELTPLGSTIYFVADDGVHDFELWKSDGSNAGTMMVRDIYPSWDFVPSSLCAVGDTLFFVGNDGIDGEELWKSDGSNSGTVQVKDINTGPSGSSPGELYAFNGELYFAADDGVNGRELWRSDGTESGTVLVKDIDTAGDSYPWGFCAAGGVLFFAADDNISGRDLWKTDGTGAGTVMVKHIGGVHGGYPSR